ncbi:MAG: DUF4031 domain-containing protein [Kineosporiaceae bacterium]|nr:DUF4031 domain-containing protein [Kineosporiaceae bacterium]
MTLMIDPPLWPAHGRRWSHLISDTSFAELHAFARALGIPERGFDGDHYDVPESEYHRMIDGGAVPVSSRVLVQALRAAGLRRQKRKGERVLASVALPPEGEGEPEAEGEGEGVARIDTLASRLPALSAVARVWLLVVHVDELLLPVPVAPVTQAGSVERVSSELVAGVLATGVPCGESPDPAPDSGPDAGPDAAPDAGPDAAPDAGPDAGPKLGPAEQVGLVRTLSAQGMIETTDVVLLLALDQHTPRPATSGATNPEWVPVERAAAVVGAPLGPLIDWLHHRG